LTNTERVSSGREPRIVVVEDDPGLLDCIATILAQENYCVFPAGDGQEALRHLRAHGADLVLTDVMMPEMDGFMLVELLRAEPRLAQIPVIFFTSAHDEGRARDLGAFDYIRKPVGRDELVERVFRGVCIGVMSSER
jgi:DNA-binding response OmpR family regulator